MKLVQLNIWQGKITIAVSRFLKEQDADVVCLQEVFSSVSGKITPLLDNMAALEVLQKDLSYPNVFFAPTYTLNAIGDEYGFGNAILSKYPLEEQRTVFTHGQFAKIDVGVDYIANTRNAQICRVAAPNGSFTLVNHHGFWAPTPVGDDGTLPAMQKLVNEIKPTEGALIMTGDLNVTPAAPAMRLFDDWLEDLTATHNLSDTLTEFGKVHDVPCDHILINDRVKARNFYKSPALVSDHSPLVLEFEI